MDSDLDIRSFYEVGSGFVRGSVQVDCNELLSLGQEEILKGNYDRVHLPLVFRYSEGKFWGDLLDTGWSSLYLVSERLLKLLESNNLTGWKTFPVEITGAPVESVPEYWGLSITGKCGPIDYGKGRVIEKRLVPTGPLCKYFVGLYVGLDQWDGTDFFIPDNSTFIVATEKAAKVIQAARLTNVRLKNLGDIEIPEIVVRQQRSKSSPS